MTTTHGADAVEANWKGLPAWVLEDAGVRPERNLIVIPYRLADGSLYAERVVAADGRRWWRPGDGRPVIPFGLERLELRRLRRFRVLVIAEGESDTLALRAALPDADGLGVPGAATWQRGWACHCRGYAAVYAGGDGDEPGRMLDDRVCLDVPGAMPLRLPDGEDLRGLLQRDGVRALLALMAAAERRRAVYRAFVEATSLDEFRRLLARAV